MSRSRKKNPIYKDVGITTYNRIIRRKNKQLVNKAIEDNSFIFPLVNEVVNQYDICDYIFRDMDKYCIPEKRYKAFLK
jgi:hypothetical protein